MCGATVRIALLLVLYSALACAQDLNNTASAQWAKVVLRLGSDSFRARQEASAELSEAGAGAVPHLVRGARSRVSEMRRRCLMVLTTYLQSDEEPTRLAALEALRGLKESDDLSLARAADACLRRGGGLSEERALEALQQQGARIRHSNSMVHVLISRTWDGGDEGLAYLKSIKSRFALSLMTDQITNDGLRHLANTPLSVLNVMRTPMTDDGLRHLRGLKILRSLSISDCDVTDAGLVHLHELVTLYSLTLRQTQVTDRGIERLRVVLPGLERVSLVRRNEIRRRETIGLTVDPTSGDTNAHLHASLSPEHLVKLKQLPNLGTVFLTRRELSDDDLRLLGDVPMKGVVVSSLGITDEGIKALEGHATLESVGIWRSRITDRGLESLAQLPQLKKLSLQQLEITDEALHGLLQKLQATGQMESLSMDRCPVTNASLRTLGNMKSLEHLLLNNNLRLDSEVIDQVARLSRLRRLELDGMKLSDDNLVVVGRLSKLETLGISNCHLTDQGLANLTRLTSLKSLTCQSAHITDAGLAQLAHLKSLEGVGLKGTAISDHGIDLLVRHCPKLMRLGLSGTQLTDKGMQQVGKLRNLEWLWIDGTQVSEAGLEALDEVTNLKYLYLDAKQVSSQSLAKFERKHPRTRVIGR